MAARHGKRAAPSAPQRAAGGVLWRPDGSGGLEVALVHRPRRDDWSLPKGKLRRGEHPLLAACREVYEETGRRPVVGRRLPTQSYVLVPMSALASTPDAAGRDPARRRAEVGSGPPGRTKTVQFWAMRAADGHSRPHDDEVDEVGWFTPGAAERRVTYDTDRDVLRAFLAVPADTAALLLVPPGQVSRRWTGGDRPLGPAGRRRAERLREALVWFGPRRVLAAGPVRCVQTVAPLAAALGADVDVDPRLEQDAYDTRPDVTRDALRALVAAGESAVVCGGDTLVSALAEALSREDGVALPPYEKGEAGVWALLFHRHRVVAADRYTGLADD